MWYKSDVTFIVRKTNE